MIVFQLFQNQCADLTPMQLSTDWHATVSGAELEQARRILVTASEDVGLADSQALIVAEALWRCA